MHKTAYFTIAAVLTVFTSCTSIYSKINGTNKKHSFKNKTEYLSFFESKYKLNPDKIYFIKEGQHWDLVTYIGQENCSYFHGITLNDSTKIDDPYLNELKSCSGRIANVIKNNGTSQKKTKPSGISQFSFTNSNNESIDFGNGKSVVFLLSANAGNSVNNSIRELAVETEELHDKNLNYYIIVLDTPNTYSNN